MDELPLRNEIRLASAARRDIRALLKRSYKEFGEEAAMRYAALMMQALRDIRDDPERQGSKERPEIMVRGARTYHVSLSRSRVKGTRVKEPRHVLLYRRREEHVIEVGRVIHDSEDLKRHLPKAYRGINTGED